MEPRQATDEELNQIAKLRDYFKEEPLNPELEKYRIVTPSGIPMIKHPLVFSLFHSDVNNHHINMHYEYTKRGVVEALKKKEFSTFVFLHERPYRLEAFLEIMDSIHGKDYWSLLGEIWIDSENIWQNKSVWKDLLSSEEPHREFFMTESDRKIFKALPEKITIYRGYTPRQNKNGYSYTIDKQRAEWFAKRFSTKKGEVRERVVLKKDCIAYLGGKNEKEIITLK